MENDLFSITFQAIQLSPDSNNMELFVEMWYENKGRMSGSRDCLFGCLKNDCSNK